MKKRKREAQSVTELDPVSEDMWVLFLQNPRWWLRRMNIELGFMKLPLVEVPSSEEGGMEDQRALTIGWNRIREGIPCTCEFVGTCTTCREFGFERKDPKRLRLEIKTVPPARESIHARGVRYMGPGMAEAALVVHSDDMH